MGVGEGGQMVADGEQILTTRARRSDMSVVSVNNNLNLLIKKTRRPTWDARFEGIKIV